MWWLKVFGESLGEPQIKINVNASSYSNPHSTRYWWYPLLFMSQCLTKVPWMKILNLDNWLRWKGRVAGWTWRWKNTSLIWIQLEPKFEAHESMRNWSWWELWLPFTGRRQYIGWKELGRKEWRFSSLMFPTLSIKLSRTSFWLVLLLARQLTPFLDPWSNVSVSYQ